MSEAPREHATPARAHPRTKSREKAATPRPPDEGDRNFNPDLRYEVPVAAWLLRQSVTRTWQDVRDGKLKAIVEGGRTFVPGAEILRRSRGEVA